MRSGVIAGAALALLSASVAHAKSDVSLRLSDDEPRTGESIQAVVGVDESARLDCAMRLLAVAPGVDKFRALAAFSGGVISVLGPSGPMRRTVRPTRRMGFVVRMKRSGQRTWRATLRLRRPGRWQLIVPNWCAPGYTWPPPATRTVTVR
jgi:hypothetical protein